jgi:hypothetical protein
MSESRRGKRGAIFCSMHRRAGDVNVYATLCR